MKTLQDLVNSAVDGLISRNETFSAHDVTTLVRGEVNSSTDAFALPANIVGGKPRWDVKHEDVRNFVNARFQAGDLTRDLKVNGISTYFEYSPVNQIVPVGTLPVLSDYDKLIDAMARIAEDRGFCTSNAFKAELYTGLTGEDFFEKLGFDELDVIEWIMELEDEYSRSINEIAVEGKMDKPIQDVIDLIANNLGVPLPTRPQSKQTPAPQPAATLVTVNVQSNKIGQLTVKDVEQYIARNGPRTFKQIQGRFKDTGFSISGLGILVDASKNLQVDGGATNSASIVRIK